MSHFHPKLKALSNLLTFYLTSPLGVSKANLTKSWSIIPLTSLKPCQLPVPYLSEMYHHPCSNISKTQEVIRDAYFIVIQYTTLSSFSSIVLTILICVHFYVSLSQSTSLIKLLSSLLQTLHYPLNFFLSHLSFQTTIKATLLKNYNASRISISHSSSFLLLIVFDWSYMKTKFFDPLS